jgi:hypothetical protein
MWKYIKRIFTVDREYKRLLLIREIEENLRFK